MSKGACSELLETDVELIEVDKEAFVIEFKDTKLDEVEQTDLETNCVPISKLDTLDRTVADSVSLVYPTPDC